MPSHRCTARRHFQAHSNPDRIHPNPHPSLVSAFKSAAQRLYRKIKSYFLDLETGFAERKAMPPRKKHLEELEFCAFIAAAVIEPWSAPASIPAAMKAVNEIAESGHKWRQRHPKPKKPRQKAPATA